MDWTFDYFVEDMNKYGLEDINSDDYRAYFVATVKGRINRFKEQWIAKHDGKMFDGEWIGDAFKRWMLDWFSDFYKDAYGQRPHLPAVYYIHVMGLPMTGDTSWFAYGNVIADAVEAAKRCRMNLD